MPKAYEPPPSKLAARIAEFIAQQGAEKYLTTRESCTCPDHKYRKRTCKHMVALLDEELRKEAEKVIEGFSELF